MSGIGGGQMQRQARVIGTLEIIGKSMTRTVVSPSHPQLDTFCHPPHKFGGSSYGWGDAMGAPPLNAAGVLKRGVLNQVYRVYGNKLFSIIKILSYQYF